jgi:hypothetical protein
MTLEVFDKNANSLDTKKVKLGGAVRQKLPIWADPDKERQQGPLVDDELQRGSAECPDM